MNMEHNHQISVKKIDFDIYDYARVKVVKNGNYVDVKHNTSNNLGGNITKLNKEEYVINGTGEIKQYNNKADFNKQDNISNLKTSFTKLRQLININFSNTEKNKLFLTLTYAENMTDYKQVQKDTQQFFKKLRRKFNYYDFMYISVVEPQQRGAWHVHIMLKAINVDYLYINCDIIADLWGHGYTDTVRLKDVGGVGNYYTAYFTDIKDGKKHSRLKLYPKGMRLYRTSSNIEKIEQKEDIYKNIIDEYGQPKYTKSLEISKDGQVIGVSTYQQFTID